jgi:hypothetical protein
MKSLLVIALLSLPGCYGVEVVPSGRPPPKRYTEERVDTTPPILKQEREEKAAALLQASKDSTTYATELTRVQKLAGAYTGTCEEDAQVTQDAASLAPSLTQARREGLEKKLREAAHRARERHWNSLSSEVEKPALGNPAKDPDAGIQAVKVSQGRLPELKCGETEAPGLARIAAKLDSRLQTLEEEKACRASPACMDKRAAQTVCQYMDAKRHAIKALARERANPSGTVNLTALNDWGRQIQDADEQIADGKKEFTEQTKKPFNEALCKK